MRACCMHADGLDVRWGMQVSRQFVPLVCGRTVAIMDQHAAAERVRLEELQDEVSLSPRASCCSPCLCPSARIALPGRGEADAKMQCSRA